MADFVTFKKATRLEAIECGYEGPKLIEYVNQQLEMYKREKEIEWEREQKNRDREIELKRMCQCS